MRFSPTSEVSILLAALFGCSVAAELELRCGRTDRRSLTERESPGLVVAGAEGRVGGADAEGGAGGVGTTGRAEGAGAEGRSGGAVVPLEGSMQDRRTCSEMSCPGVMAYCIMLVPTAVMAPSFARSSTALIPSWLVPWEVVELMIVLMSRPAAPDRSTRMMIAVRRLVALRGREGLLTTGARLGRRLGSRFAEESDEQTDLEP